MLYGNRVFIPEALDNGSGLITGTIIGDDDFIIIIMLHSPAPEHFFQPGRGIVGCEDDADFQEIS
jgi:hypothetical protein